VAVLAFLAVPGRAAIPLLGGRLDLGVGSQPYALASGDLNGDGRADLVVANSNAGSISAYLGNGAGGFGPRSDCPVGSSPSAVVVADFNGDGRADVVVANFASPFLSLLPGNGAGGFGPRADFPCPYSVTALAAADLDGDGRLDLAGATTQYSGEVMVLLGDGAGGFSPWAGYAVGTNPYSLAVGDLNGDGRLDLVVGNHVSSSLSVLLGSGGGAFGPRTDHPTGSAPISVALGDLNGDGRLDVAVANNGTLSSSAGIFLGDGAGGLGTMTEFTTGSNSQPHSIAIGDVDLDGKPDLAVACFESGTSALEVLPGDGSGGFGPAVAFATRLSPIAVVATDFNGDGRLDFAVADWGSDTVSVFAGNANGGFGAKADYAVPGYPYGVALGDMNGDGRPDLAAGNSGASAASVLLGSGAGRFSPHTDFGTGANPYSVALADVDANGTLDLIAANHDPGTVSVLPGNGAGGFGTRVDYTAGLSAWAVAVADFNRDGRPDLAVANAGAGNVSILLGTGGGGFGGAANVAVGTNPYGVATGDLNGDGIPDLVTANGGSNTISVLLGNGSGGFPTRTDLAAGTDPVSIAIGDVTGDGKFDLAVATGGYPWRASVLLGDGTGGFGPRVDFPVGAYLNSIAIGDVNGDGRPDLVVSDTYYATVDVLYGNGAGSFGAATSLPTASGLSVAALGDVNGDGRLDIVASVTGGISVLLALQASRTTLASSPPSAMLGAPMILTATVSAVAPGGGTPGGTVSFYDGFTLLGTSPVNAGIAALSLFAPRLGTRALTAVFNGDGVFQRSFSPERDVRIVAGAGPALASIRDVANDQGRQVRVGFAASPYDYPGAPAPIARYEVYRRVDPALAAQRAPASAAIAGPNGVLVDGWDYVGDVAAHGETAYGVVVPTLADSNSAGLHAASFFVRAATATPAVYYDSAPDSGYSADNLAPAVPSPFAGAYAGGATHLHWGPNLLPDLWYYRLYRGGSAGFVPGPGNLVATPSDTGYTDPGPAGSYYKLSAVDVNGNESAYALLTPAGTTSVEGGGTIALALEGARPNPVRGHGLVVHFALPGAAPARLELLDVSGRRLAARDVGALGPGRHDVDLAPGKGLPAGVYLLRLTQGALARSTRVAVLP
jgi:hypothetical protein